jgi:exonuclease VII large subunit
MREKVKEKEKLVRENEELKKKIKNEEYESVRELKERIDQGRKEVEKLQSTLKRQVLLEKEVKAIEEEIFKCKFQIMNAFNYANERGGGKLMFEMQEACGLKEI